VEKKSDESGTNVNTSFSCKNCGQTFNARPECREHSSFQH